MSISNTSDIPLLAGGFINLDMITKKTDVTLRRTKIICTIGPACWDVPQLETLIDAGMNVARFNFSHGDHKGHGAVLERVRTAAKNKQRNIGETFETVLKGLRSFFSPCHPNYLLRLNNSYPAGHKRSRSKFCS